MDSRLSRLAQAGKTQSGCTAVTVFLRVEELGEGEPKGFINNNIQSRGLMLGRGEEELEAQTSAALGSTSSSGSAGNGEEGADGLTRRKSSGSGKRIRDFVRGLTGSTNGDRKESEADTSGGTEEKPIVAAADGSRVDAIQAKSERGLRRVLYTANVGDARAVLWSVPRTVSVFRADLDQPWWKSCSIDVRP